MSRNNHMSFITLCSTCFVIVTALGSIAWRNLRGMDLKTEFRNKADQGFALVALTDQQYNLRPIDAPPRFFGPLDPHSICVMGEHGQRFVCYTRNGIPGTDSFSLWAVQGQLWVRDLDGTLISHARVSNPGFRPLAFDDIHNRISFKQSAVTFGNSASTQEFGWATMDMKTIATITRGDISDADWSFDGSRLAYTLDGKIVEFELSTSSTRVLVDGNSPTWHPNRNWLSFVTADGHAGLIDESGAQIPWALASDHPISPVRWSPDGNFVAFTEKASWIRSLWLEIGDLELVRVADNASRSINTFYIGSNDEALYQWTRSYQEFCHQCRRATSR